MHILIVEDNPIIGANIAEYLQCEGHQVVLEDHGERAYERIMTQRFDCIVIDRMLPGIDGLSLARMMRSKHIHTPFLFLTALDKQIDKIEGLSIGADDYLVKPFNLEELHLRLLNISKRSGEGQSGSSRATLVSVHRFGEIEINLQTGKIQKSHHEVTLSPKEYGILKLLLNNRGHIITKEAIYESVWGERESRVEDLETISVHIAYIRKKLSNDLIRTQKLEGYIID